MIVYVGIDASKGYADFCFQSAESEVLLETKLDDVRSGHERLLGQLKALRKKHGVELFVVGVESSGGIERNWMRSLRDWSSELPLKRRHINPLLVKNHRDRKLHYSVTDRSSAREIADLLRYLPSETGEVDPELVQARRLERHLAGVVERRGILLTELQGVLVTSHPELVPYGHDRFPGWLLTVLKKYPTMKALSRARTETLAKIPYVTPERAQELKSLARDTVASHDNEMTAILVQSLVEEIVRLRSVADKLQSQLEDLFKGDRILEILRSIPGIGPKTALILRLYYGDFKGFHSGNAVVAFAGLDPRIHKSGDGEIRRRISRRGHARLRAALYLPALSAIRSNERFGTFHQRLVAQGKAYNSGVVAVMAKLLRIAYACVLKDTLFDPNIVLSKRPPKAERVISEPEESLSLAAPISRREKRRRKEKAAAATTRSCLKKGSQPRHKVGLS